MHITAERINGFPNTIPKALPMKGRMYHARQFPGTEHPVAMGSPYETKGKGRVARGENLNASAFSKPSTEHSKDAFKMRTSGGGALGL
jgi:hypothetical protein